MRVPDNYPIRRVAACLVGLCLLAGVCLPGAPALAGGEEDEDAEEQQPAPDDPPPLKEIKMFAENWKWTPRTIRVAQGTLLRIEVQNVDSTHRFDLKGYGLKIPLPQDETTVIEFLADKAGKFKWKCGRPCGNGCPKMTGELVVD